MTGAIGFQEVESFLKWLLLKPLLNLAEVGGKGSKIKNLKIVVRVRPCRLHRPLSSLQRTFIYPFSFNCAYEKRANTITSILQRRKLRFGEPSGPIANWDQTLDVSAQLLVLGPFLHASPRVSEQGSFWFRIIGRRGGGWSQGRALQHPNGNPSVRSSVRQKQNENLETSVLVGSLEVSSMTTSSIIFD